MKILFVVWMWLAINWPWVAGAFVGSVLCRFSADWLLIHDLKFLVWYGWIWWLLGIALLAGLIMRFVFGGVSVQ